MKKMISLLLMSFVGLVGTYAWAGTAREDSVERLQKSVDVLHAVMATPDKGTCDYPKLTAPEAKTLTDAENKRNYTACLTGHGYCDLSRLTPSEVRAVPTEHKPVSR